ncbi:MAG: single-stranded DNA-binding protein [Deltaproteobacteria bacterium]|nr:single-stranded DNA-binding protein [Deltaproteobacteria bacterium]
MKPQVTMVGNLTADVTATFANDDGTHKRCLFTVACNNSYVKNDEKIKTVDFIPCIAWNSLVDMLQKWGLKGRKVHIVGTLEAYQPPANENGEYPPTKVQVRAEKIEFCALEDNVKAKLNAQKAATATPAQQLEKLFPGGATQQDVLKVITQLLGQTQPAQPAQTEMTANEDVPF